MSENELRPIHEKLYLIFSLLVAIAVGEGIDPAIVDRIGDEWGKVK